MSAKYGMRWDHIFEGAAAKQYLAMYSAIPLEDNRELTTFLDELSSRLKRSDRIQWVVRWHRIWYAREFMKKAGEDAIPERAIQKMLQSTGSQMGFDEAANEGRETVRLLDELQHYLGLPVKAIQDLVWGKQTPDQMFTQLDKLEEDWRANISDRTVEHRGNETVVLQFPDNYAWIDLKTHYCSKESAAMGHCGNEGGNRGDTILSLRKRILDDLYEPALTFILDRNGLLGEMKGRGNDKPTERYHPYIIALLKLPIIKGLKGGGYMPENNFKIDDLDDEMQKALFAEKPALKPVWLLYDDWHAAKVAGTLTPELSEAFSASLEGYLSAHGNFLEVDYENEEIVFSRNSARSLAWPSNLLGRASDAIDEDFIADALIAVGIARERAFDLAQQVNGDYEDRVVEAAIPYNFNYSVDSVYAESEGDDVVVKAAIRWIVREEDEVVDSISGWDDERDDYDYSDTEFSDDDPIIHEVLKYAAVTSDKSIRASTSGIVDAILQQYGEGDEAGYRASRTTNDPDQMKFDFDR